LAQSAVLVGCPYEGNGMGEEDEELTKEGEDTDCKDPEYGNPNLKFMTNSVQQYPRITKEEDTYNKLIMKYDFRCYG
jgi:hypothetical protein